MGNIRAKLKSNTFHVKLLCLPFYCKRTFKWPKQTSYDSILLMVVRQTENMIKYFCSEPKGPQTFSLASDHHFDGHSLASI